MLVLLFVPIVLNASPTLSFAQPANSASEGANPGPGGNAADQTDDESNAKIDIEKVDAYLAAPILQLAAQLRQQGREQAAVACEQWIPPRRSDAITTFFSSIPSSAVHPELLQSPYADAFAAARNETARRALRGAVRSAESNEGELALGLLWRAIREEPNNPQARRLIGLPNGNTTRATVRPGREAPAVLGWPPRSFLVAQSKHFRIYSTASKRSTTELVEDLERFFEVWSQIFFQQWTTDQQLCDNISTQKPIGLPNVLCDVVLFGDRESYIRMFGAENPAARQSTGYYSPDKKLTLLFDGEDADSETRYHEVTHQLLQEATPTVVNAPGKQSGFWIVEGIASYVESIWFHDSFATVGGWQAPRLQYSRARILPTKNAPTLESIMGLGTEEFQSNAELAALYSTIAAYTHMLMSEDETRKHLLKYLKSVYQGRISPELLLALFSERKSDQQLIEFLQLATQDVSPELPSNQSLTSLCLGRTDVTPEWLAKISPQHDLQWLDLGYLDVQTADVTRLLDKGTQLQRLNLEGTKVDDQMGQTLNNQRRLEELDLSFTPVSDNTIQQLRSLDSLETLWLTGTAITDESIPTLKSLRSLKMLDVQRTSITAAGLQELQTANPEIKLNPLQLVPKP